MITFRAIADTAIYGQPVFQRRAVICADWLVLRTGQSYVAQEQYLDDDDLLWYEIFYNHRVAWVPSTEVTAG